MQQTRPDRLAAFLNRILHALGQTVLPGLEGAVEIADIVCGGLVLSRCEVEVYDAADYGRRGD